MRLDFYNLFVKMISFQLFLVLINYLFIYLFFYYNILSNPFGQTNKQIYYLENGIKGQ